jgi:hypothetical protein
MDPPENPYGPPRAPVADPPGTRHRPFWVWVICVFSALGVVASIFTSYLMFSGKIPATGAAERFFASLGASELVSMSVDIGLQAALAVTLFRLQRVAFPVAVGGFLFGLLSTGLNLLNPDYAAMVQESGYTGMVVGWLVNVAILVYIHRLRESGVLR